VAPATRTMSLNVDALRQSFEVVVTREPEVARRFYEILFERYPQVKSLFGRNSQQAQQKMLTQALVMVIDHLEDGVWLDQTLAGLGARHVGYGVTREMYDWVGDSLLATLAEIAGPDWTPEIASAWTDAYGAISGLMLAGAERAEARAVA
jgi:hemoglobin-like flavoprotein